MPQRTYSPDDGVLVINGRLLTDWEGLDAGKVEDTYSQTGGTTGHIVITKNLNRMGKISIDFNQTSQSNDFLTALENADAVIFASWSETNGITVKTIPAGKFVKSPNVSRQKDTQNNTWEIIGEMTIDSVGGITT